MDKYTYYCTEEQTKRAIELGAPIHSTCYGDGAIKQIWYKDPENDLTGMGYYDMPTIEQMMNWMIEEGFEFVISRSKVYISVTVYHDDDDDTIYFREQYNPKDCESFIGKAIDAALTFLEKNNVQ